MPLPYQTLATPDNSELYAADIRETSFHALWSEVGGATMYDINVKLASSPDYTGSNLVAHAEGIKGTSYTVTGLTPGTSYKYQIRARNGNSSQDGGWSKSSSKTFTTASPNVKLVLVQSNGFNTDEMTVGSTYHYSAYVKNSSKEDWSGAFYFKEGNTDIKSWSKTIQGGSCIYLDCDYRPTTAGTKELTLYYLNNGSSSGIPVPAGILSNPISVNVKSSINYACNLTMDGDLTLNGKTEETLNIGDLVTIIGKVRNTSSDDWSGELAFTEDGNIVYHEEVTIKGGKTKTLPLYSYQSAASSASKHQIGIAYKTESNKKYQMVPTSGFVNPATLILVGGSCTSNEIKLEYVTKDLAPSTVCEGTDVFYHFKATTIDGTSVKGIKASFGTTISSGYGLSVSGKNYIAGPSDDDGVLTVCLETSGKNAVAAKGQTVELQLIVLTNENGEEVQLLNGSPSDYRATLTIYDGIPIFQSIESCNLNLELGVSANLGKHANLGLSVPLGLRLNWDENGTLSSYATSLEGKFDASIHGKLSFLGADIGGEFGGEVGANTETEYSTANLRQALISTLYDALNLYTAIPSTDATIYLSACGMKTWLEKHYDVMAAVNSRNTSTYLQLEASASADIPTDWVKIAQYSPLFNEPRFFVDVNKINGKGKVSYKWENGTQRAYNNEIAAAEQKETRKLGIELSSSYAEELLNFKGSIIDDLWKKCTRDDFAIGDYLGNGEKVSSIKNGMSLSLDQSHTITHASPGLISSISTASKITAKYSNSLSKKMDGFIGFEIPDALQPIDASFGMNLSYTMKLTTKGDFAAYLQKETVDNGSASIARIIHPIFNPEQFIPEPDDVFRFYNNGTAMLSSKNFVSTERFKLPEALKLEQQLSSSIYGNISVPFWESGIFKLKFNASLSVGADWFPSESYYSIADKRFYPIALRPSGTIGDIAQYVTDKLAERIEYLFDDREKIDIETQTEELATAQRINLRTSSEHSVHFDNYSSVNSKGQRGHDPRMVAIGARRTPALAEKVQKDICTFQFDVPIDGNCFDHDTDLDFFHFYPAGGLLAITESNDSLFVVSEVVNLGATKEGDGMEKAPYGTFTLTTQTGADDLTPFGLPSDQLLDVYHAAPGSDIWHYVGPAGGVMQLDSLGLYIMATSIKNDIQAPEITAFMDRSTGIMKLAVTDNIGIRVNSLQVYINGELRELTPINESYYALQLTFEDRQAMITLYATVSDLAGNPGHVFQLFDYDPETAIEMVETDTEEPTLRVRRGNVTIDGAEEGDLATLFALDGTIIAKERADNEGRIEMNAHNVPSGTYVVTISSGWSKKISIR